MRAGNGTEEALFQYRSYYTKLKFCIIQGSENGVSGDFCRVFSPFSQKAPSFPYIASDGLFLFCFIYYKIFGGYSYENARPYR
jgi:hypothetical protein